MYIVHLAHKKCYIRDTPDTIQRDKVAAADRHTYAALRQNRHDINDARHAMAAYLDSILFENCHPDTLYIAAFAK